MAFRSNSPITVTLPPFRGVTRRLILAALAVFFALLILGLFARELSLLIASLSSLQPAMAYKLPWQFLTYPFINTGIFSLAFAALSVWFFGAVLESELGSAWMGEFFLSSTVGGGLLAALLTWTVTRHVPGLGPLEMAAGLWPFSLSLLLAFAHFHADQELNFNFILRVKAKYMAAIYLLVYLAIALSSHERFDAMLVLANALCGWLFVRFAPRRGWRFAMGDGVEGVRNAWVRARRRRAARKFSVYMQKQGRDVNFDASGRYIDPDAERRNSKDRKWMN